MTNTVFFSTIYRDDESVSSSSRSETSEPPQTEAQASSSAYSVVGKALLACARPQVEADEDVDDSTANTSAPASNTNENGSVMKDWELESIRYKELQTATSDFHDRNRLGRVDFVSVFKGWIDENTLTASGEGIAVAVKGLHWRRAERMAKWLQEINYLGRFHHPNLVKTLAYCTEGEQTMVVYEFMPRGSLADHLFQMRSNPKPLSWSLRLKIALGAAKCLHFLHMNNAVHGNIRSSTILLDSHYNSKLSFWVDRNTDTRNGYFELPNSDIAWMVNKDYIFIAPELLNLDTDTYTDTYTDILALANKKSNVTATGDVYSFGVVLLEILLWCKVNDEVLELARSARAEGKQQPDRLICFLNGHIWGDECPKEIIRRVMLLAKLCISVAPCRRIAMDLVVQDLTAIEEIHKQLIRASPIRAGSRG